MSKETYKTTVSHGTIKEMIVDMPVRANCFDAIKAFAKAYVKYATSKGLVSDDVLISSIGTRFAREACKFGFLDRIPKENHEAIEGVFDDDEIWAFEVLKARLGRDKAESEMLARYPGGGVAFSIAMRYKDTRPELVENWKAANAA